MDVITHELEKSLKDLSLFPAVRAAVAHGLGIIDKYYSKTDESIMWKTAMSKSIYCFVMAHIHWSVLVPSSAPTIQA